MTTPFLVNRKDKSDSLFTSYICKAKCSDNEPKDRSDTRSVVFDEVESSDQWIGKINPIACLQAIFCKAKCSDQWIGKINPIACLQATFCKAKCSDNESER